MSIIMARTALLLPSKVAFGSTSGPSFGEFSSMLLFPYSFGVVFDVALHDDNDDDDGYGFEDAAAQ